MGSIWYLQSEALLKKNLTIYGRHLKSKPWLLVIPALVFGILISVKLILNNKTSDEPNGPIIPMELLPALAVRPDWCRAEEMQVMAHDNPLDAYLWKEGSPCPETFLITGKNRTIAEGLAGNMYTNSSVLNSTDAIDIADGVWGTDEGFPYVDDEASLYAIEVACPKNSTKSLHAKVGDKDLKVKTKCLQALHMWRENYTEITDTLTKAYYKGGASWKLNGIAAAYDFLDSNASRLSANVWYNPTFKTVLKDHVTRSKVEVVEGVQAVLSTVWDAYLQFLKGSSPKMVLEYIGEMGKPTSHIRDPDIASTYAYIFFQWIFLLIFPATLSTLVYEKQHKFRIMMKMHGFHDGLYLLNMYLQFFVVGFVYLILLVLLGSLSGLPYFSLNSFGLQILFYGLNMNLFIVSAFFLSGFFSSTKFASVAAQSLVFGTRLCVEVFFKNLIVDTSFPVACLVILELFPGFSLYRGMYDFQMFGLKAKDMGTFGMHRRILRNKDSGIRESLIIMSAEWLFFIFIFALGNGFESLRSFVLNSIILKLRWSEPFPIPTTDWQPASLPNQDVQDEDIHVLVQLDKEDIDKEQRKVTDLIHFGHTGYPIIADNLMKVSLSVASGECFGLLGPNEAGKTSFFNTMTGLEKPSSGKAFIQNRNLHKQTSEGYRSMGVCPQYNLLWNLLTGREHLMFYGRLKKLTGPHLAQGVEDSLRNANLLEDSDKQVGTYNGDMRKRLSVAISLIGNPKVVFVDEPTTGVDPASRDEIWDALETAKQNGAAILLTTHSMEEAERLCDRVGLMVNGTLRCIGSPEQLKERWRQFSIDLEDVIHQVCAYWSEAAQPETVTEITV